MVSYTRFIDQVLEEGEVFSVGDKMVQVLEELSELPPALS